ncbi:MAG: anti-sigma factor [Lewinellaceae bacterium]|nr:anti-sigma factor [Lewinellaceae bacterium]
MMDKDQLLSSGLLEQYVLGLTDEEESRMVEEYAARYEDVRVELSLLQQAMEHYAAQHSAAAKASNAEAEKDKSNLGLRKLSGRTLWPLAAVFAMIWGVYGALQTDLRHKEAKDWEEKYTQLEKECQSQGQTQRALADLSAFLCHRHTAKVVLNGCSMSKGAFAIAFWNPAAQKGYLDIGSLPPPPKGKTYQLWADVDGHMVNAGIVEFHAGQLQEVHFIDKAASLNLTLEPDGGSKEPTVSLLQANGLLASVE